MISKRALETNDRMCRQALTNDKARAKSFVTIDVPFNIALRGLNFQRNKKRSQKNPCEILQVLARISICYI